MGGGGTSNCCCFMTYVCCLVVQETILIDNNRQSCQKATGMRDLREEGLQNGQSVRKVSCQHTTRCILNTNITKKLIDDDLFQKSCLLSEKNSDLLL